MVAVLGEPLVESDHPRLLAAHGNNRIFTAAKAPAYKGKHDYRNTGETQQLDVHSKPQKTLATIHKHPKPRQI